MSFWVVIFRFFLLHFLPIFVTFSTTCFLLRRLFSIVFTRSFSDIFATFRLLSSFSVTLLLDSLSSFSQTRFQASFEIYYFDTSSSLQNIDTIFCFRYFLISRHIASFSDFSFHRIFHYLNRPHQLLTQSFTSFYLHTGFSQPFFERFSSPSLYSWHFLLLRLFTMTFIAV